MHQSTTRPSPQRLIIWIGDREVALGSQRRRRRTPVQVALDRRERAPRALPWSGSSAEVAETIVSI